MRQIFPPWEKLAPLVSASRKLSDSLRKKTERLLEQSNARLSPLQDPLSLDFSSHRWFAGKREENYSDWLSWIIEQLGDAKLVFRLLKIEAPSLAEKCWGVKPEVRREYPVEEGHDDQSGRLDILIRYSPEALIAVEVKIDDTDYTKNEGYYKSVENLFGKETKYYKLLVIDAEYDGSFKVIKWKDVCLELRRMVSDKSVKEPLLCALMLAFAGAVEQNLLELSIVKSGWFHSGTIDYLLTYLPTGGNTMVLTEDIAKRQLVKDGLSVYLDALYAVEEFQHEIIGRIRKVFYTRIADMSSAMKISLQDKSISKDNNKEKHSPTFSRIGLTIGGFDTALNVIYISFYIERQEFKIRQGVGISFETANSGVRETLLKKCKSSIDNFEIWDGNEIGLADYSIDATNIDSFEDKLNQVIDKWITVWKSLEGGVKGLETI